MNILFYLEHNIVPVLRIIMLNALLLLTSVQPLVAQEPEFPSCRVLHFTSDNGLPQNSVKSILYDHAGNMWIATEGGLVMFNGSRFISPKTATGSPRISYLVKDRAGNLYLTDEFSSLYKIDEKNIDIARINKPGQRGDSIFWLQYSGATPKDFSQHLYHTYAFLRVLEDTKGVHYFINKGIVHSFDKKLHDLGPATNQDAVFTFQDKLVCISAAGKASIYSSTTFLGNKEVQFKKTPAQAGNLFRYGFWFSSG